MRPKLFRPGSWQQGAVLVCPSLWSCLPVLYACVLVAARLDGARDRVAAADHVGKGLVVDPVELDREPLLDRLGRSKELPTTEDLERLCLLHGGDNIAAVIVEPDTVELEAVAERIAGAVERELGIQGGETDESLTWTLETVGCLGACALGPIVVVDGEYYGQMTSAKATRLLEKITKADGNGAG